MSSCFASIHKLGITNTLFAIDGTSGKKAFEPMKKIGQHAASSSNGECMVHYNRWLK